MLGEGKQEYLLCNVAEIKMGAEAGGGVRMFFMYLNGLPFLFFGFVYF